MKTNHIAIRLRVLWKCHAYIQ